MNAIKAGSKESDGKKLNVVIIAHGNEDQGPEIDDNAGSFAALIGSWVAFMRDATDTGFSHAQCDAFQTQFKDKIQNPFSQIGGLVREITFTSCDIADTPGGRQLLDVIAGVLGCTIRAFKGLTDTSANQTRIEVGPNKDTKPMPTTYQEFVYETHGT